LRIQVEVVIPGQPGRGVQLAVRQRHHLREAGRDTIDGVDDALGRHNILITHDPDRSIVHAAETLACACAACQGKGTATHLGTANINVDMSRRAAHISNADLRIQVEVVIPGQPVRGTQLAVG